MKTLRCLLLATLLSTQPIAFAAPGVQVGFSPEESARELVLGVIGSATKSIQMMAYSFTAPDIMQALADAQARGVEVRVVIDKKRNQGKASKAAMRYVTSRGVKLRIDDHYNIQHDKVIIVDGKTVETGSFNFARSAETANSENVVVMLEMPEIARQYLEHWQSRWELGVAYQVDSGLKQDADGE